MNLLATVDPWYVFACTAVPIVWGAVVHGLFDVWRRRRSAKRDRPADSVVSEAEEPNLP